MPKGNLPPCCNPFGDENHKKGRHVKDLRKVNDDIKRDGRLAAPNIAWDEPGIQLSICTNCRRKLNSRATSLLLLDGARYVLQQRQPIPPPANQLAEVNPVADPPAAVQPVHILPAVNPDARGVPEAIGVPAGTDPHVVAQELAVPGPSSEMLDQRTPSTVRSVSATTPQRGQKRRNLYPSLDEFTEDSEIEKTPTVSVAQSMPSSATSSFFQFKKVEDFNTTLKSIGASPLRPSDAKKRSKLVRKYLQFGKFAQKAIKRFSGVNPKPFVNQHKPCTFCKTLLRELGAKFKTQETRTDKYKLLTCIPKVFSINKVVSDTGCSLYEGRRASKLKMKEGAFSFPLLKFGRPLDAEVVQTVVNFYLSDQNSRESPNTRDVIKVRNDEGQYIPTAKRRILHNLEDLYNLFKDSHPSIKISVTKFASIRPKQCVWPGRRRQHNVCVCEIHQNFEFLLETMESEEKIKDFVNSVVCGEEVCYLGLCTRCPKEDLIEALFDKISEDQEITFTQWLHTDSVEIKRVTTSLDDFKTLVKEYVPKIVEHEYVYRMQSQMIEDITKNIVRREAVVSIHVDFSQNYSCVVQDSAQGFYWSSKQVTVHPFFVRWWREDIQEVSYKSYIVISDDLRHDANTFHVFRTNVLKKVLEDLAELEIRKVYYISDGAGSQYKNFKNMCNLMYHKTEFGVDAEWVFSATSHGKSSCDGIGAVVKCATRNESLKKGVIIMNARQMYDFCVTKFRHKENTMEFFHVSSIDADLVRDELEDRYKNYNKIAGIRKHHVFIPQDDTTMRIYRAGDTNTYSDINFRRGEELDFGPFNLKVGTFYVFVVGATYQVGMCVDINVEEGDVSMQSLKINKVSGVCSWPDPLVFLDIPYREILLESVDPAARDGFTLDYGKDNLKLAREAYKRYKNKQLNPETN